MRINTALAAGLLVPLISVLAASVLAQASLAPPPPPPAHGEEQGLERQDKRNRAVVGVGGGLVGYHVIKGVGSTARSVVGKAPVIRDIPVYGSHIGKVPIIGSHVLKTNIPTTLGQAPFIGKTISNIPVVGPVIAGPPHPLLVGAVAVDTYVLPKYAPCGWTESALFTNTDFNSAPRLRQYVNYLAPLPYTHPPIYAPGPLSPGVVDSLPVATIVPASATAQPEIGTIRVEY